MDTAVHFPVTPKAVLASKLTLSRRMNVEEAFRDIVRNCIEQVGANAIGVSKFHDVACLHQMRVGLRRMRSALAMFEDVLSLPEPLQADLDWLVAELGPVRDWDVLAETTLAAVQEALPALPSLAELKQAALNRSHGLHASAADAVASMRYTRLMLGLDNWAADRGWRAALVPGDKALLKTAVRPFARGILDANQRRLRKRGRHLAEAEPELRHRLRIAAKKTRYAAEFFGSLYPGSKLRPYVKALSGLQDALGKMNDAAVAQRLLGELVAAQPALNDSAVFVRGYLAGRTDEGRVALQRLWKQFARLDAPQD